ncbi:DUF6069 family protein [Actinomadura hibisca]|uniref:DUF6069 family protein n=1 Tax=Actinomadura hibisca TaxID=68565 RepID=UPI0008325564|nr:DUF6069 family protein [Actinomadura hibisca]
MTAALSVRPRPAVSTRRLRATMVGLAPVLNGAVYLAASTLGVDFDLTAPGAAEPYHFTLPVIVVASLLFALLGWAALALLERWTRHAVTIWSVLAATVTVLSMVPIGIEDGTWATRISLALTHVVVAAALLPTLRASSR